MLVVQVDVIGAEAAQGALDGDADAGGLLSSWPGPRPACEIIPNLVASTT